MLLFGWSFGVRMVALMVALTFALMFALMFVLMFVLRSQLGLRVGGDAARAALHAPRAHEPAAAALHGRRLLGGTIVVGRCVCPMQKKRSTHDA